MISDRAAPSRVRFAASRPGLLRADLEGGATLIRCDGLAGSELLDGAGRVDPASLDSSDPTGFRASRTSQLSLVPASRLAANQRFCSQPT